MRGSVSEGASNALAAACAPTGRAPTIRAQPARSAPSGTRTCSARYERVACRVRSPSASVRSPRSSREAGYELAQAEGLIGRWTPSPRRRVVSLGRGLHWSGGAWDVGLRRDARSVLYARRDLACPRRARPVAHLALDVDDR